MRNDEKLICYRVGGIGQWGSPKRAYYSALVAVARFSLTDKMSQLCQSWMWNTYTSVEILRDVSTHSLKDNWLLPVSFHNLYSFHTLFFSRIPPFFRTPFFLGAVHTVALIPQSSKINKPPPLFFSLSFFFPSIGSFIHTFFYIFHTDVPIVD
jgi:hypothetical protein